MPLFLSDEEFSQCSHDAAVVAKKADAFIRGLLNELETVKAKADASDINAEQNCSLIEQKYLSLTAEFSKVESQVAELQSTLDQRLTELSEVQGQKQKIELQSVRIMPIWHYLALFVLLLIVIDSGFVGWERPGDREVENRSGWTA